MFRRRHSKTDLTQVDDESLDLIDGQEVGESSDPQELTGPYDDADDVTDDLPRLDFGSLRIPVVADIQIRLNTDSNNINTGVVITEGDSSVELAPFAAPRREGLWDEARQRLQVSLQAGGATTKEVAGEFGVELWARVPTNKGAQSIRFVGIDGPRWLLRVAFGGQAGSAGEVAPVLDQLVRGTIVVRGSDAKPVGDLLALTMPPELVQASEAQQAVDADLVEADDLAARRTLPKQETQITEVR